MANEAAIQDDSPGPAMSRRSSYDRIVYSRSGEAAESKPPEVVDDNRLRVRYEVPLVWLLSGAVFLACQAALVYFSVQRQGELIAGLTESQKELTKQVTALREQQAPRDLKDAQHDFTLQDHDRRLLVLENIRQKGR